MVLYNLCARSVYMLIFFSVFLFDFYNLIHLKWLFITFVQFKTFIFLLSLFNQSLISILNISFIFFFHFLFQFYYQFNFKFIINFIPNLFSILFAILFQILFQIYFNFSFCIFQYFLWSSGKEWSWFISDEIWNKK